MQLNNKKNVFNQQEELLDKRFAKEREFRKEDLIRAEDKQLETEMIREGRDSVAVRNWIKGGQKGEVPAIKTSYIRNGNSELMTVTSAIKLGDQVFKPGDPVYVYQMTQQVGPRKGETIQMARIGNQDIPFENLMFQKFTGTELQVGYHLNETFQSYVPKPTLLYMYDQQPCSFKFWNGTTHVSVTEYMPFGQDALIQGINHSLNFSADESTLFKRANFKQFICGILFWIFD